MKSILAQTNLLESISRLDIGIKEFYLSIELGQYATYNPTNRKMSPYINFDQYDQLYRHYSDVTKHYSQRNVSVSTIRQNNSTTSIFRDHRVTYVRNTHHWTRTDTKYPFRYLVFDRETPEYTQWAQKFDQTFQEQITTFNLTDRTKLILERIEDDQPTYKARIEYQIQQRNNFQQLERLIRQVYRVIYRSLYSYTLAQYLKVVKAFNSLNSVEGPFLDRSMAEWHRPVQWLDLTYNKMVENSEVVWAITHRVDGRRAFLLVYDRVLWLIYPKLQQIRRLTPDLGLKLGSVFDKLNGFLFDGSVVERDSHKLNSDGKVDQLDYFSQTYYIYDLIRLNAAEHNQRDLLILPQDLKHHKPGLRPRYDMKLIQSIGLIIRRMYSNSPANFKFDIRAIDHIILSKNRYTIDGSFPVEPFPLAIIEMLEKQDKLNFPTKGLIFRAVNKPYGDETMQWSSHPVKLKLNWTGNQLVDANDQKFVGSEQFPFRYDFIGDERPGMVTFSYHDGKPHFESLNFDRRSNSTYSQLLSQWYNMVDPIKATDLLGQSFGFMSHQQFQLAQKLYSDNGSFLLDLNPNPKLIYWWQKYYHRVIAWSRTSAQTSGLIEAVKKVYGQEPIVLTQFNATALSLDNNVVIIELNKLDIGLISSITVEFLDSRVDVISAMWLFEVYPSLIQQLPQLMAEVMSERGKLHWLSFNYDLISDIELQLEGMNLWKAQKQTIDINSDLVSQITELYPTAKRNNRKEGQFIRLNRLDIDQIITKLENNNYNLVSHQRNDQTRLLHFSSYIVTAAFEYGTFSNLRARPELQKPIQSLKLKAAPPKLAYVMLLIKDDSYLPGILTTAQSLAMSDSKIDRVLMVANDPNISQGAIKKLQKSGLFTQIVRIDYLSSIAPEMSVYDSQNYSEWMYRSYTKWQCLNPAQYKKKYDKILFIDADLMVVKNIDHLFRLPTPAACFSYVRTTNVGEVKINLNADYPQKHAAKVPNSLIKEKIKYGGVYTASMVLLRPNKDDYLAYRRQLDDMSAQPNKVIEDETGPIESEVKAEWYRRKYRVTEVPNERKYTYKDIIATDERSLAYFYNQRNPEGHWINIHPRFNTVVSYNNTLIKPGTYEQDHYTPNVVHFIQTNKPWKTDKALSPISVLIELWYYVFVRMIRDNKLKFKEMQQYIVKSRHKRLNKIISSKNPSKFYRFRFVFSRHRYLLPWLQNTDFNPWKLRWAPGERPTVTDKWFYDPNSVFIINSTRYNDREQPRPGFGPTETIPKERITEFKPLEKYSNWRYLLYALSMGQIKGKQLEQAREILILTKNAALVSARDPNTGYLHRRQSSWDLMNQRHLLLKEKETDVKRQEDVGLVFRPEPTPQEQLDNLAQPLAGLQALAVSKEDGGVVIIYKFD